MNIVKVINVKIKLLILLLISINLINCTKDNVYQSNKYSVGYIGGSLDGLFLKTIRG